MHNWSIHENKIINKTTILRLLSFLLFSKKNFSTLRYHRLKSKENKNILREKDSMREGGIERRCDVNNWDIKHFNCI